MRINEFIKKLREGRNIKQYELAKKIGISPNHLSQLESGKRNISIELLEKLSEALNCPMADLLDPPHPVAYCDDYGKVLRHIREEKNVSIETLANMIGVSKEILMQWEENGKKIDSNKLYKILHLLKTSEEYFWGDDDNIGPPVPELEKDSNSSLVKMDFIHSSGKIILIPVFERAYSACCGAGFPNADQIYACAEDFIDMPTSFIGHVSPETDKWPFIIYAEGDSMIQAGITDGSQLLINPAEEIYDGDSALIEYSHNKSIAVKRIYWLNGSGIEIRSANGDGWKRTFSLDDQKEGLLRIIGKVVWCGNKPKRG